MANPDQSKNTSGGLFEYFRIANEDRKRELSKALASLDVIPDSVAIVYSFETSKFIFVSPGTKDLLDYPQKYQKDQLANPGTALRLMNWQSAFAKKIAAAGFDYTVPMLSGSYESLKQTHAARRKVYQAGIVLEFEPGGDVRTFFGISIVLDEGSDKLPVRKMLLNRKLKDIHKLLLRPSLGDSKHENRALIKIKAPYYQSPKLTKKEKELLLLLSQGVELKHIASEMNVSYFTSEAHRKNLFEKFEVHNVAELIQKASKMYWLE